MTSPPSLPAGPHPTFLRDFVETRGFLLGCPSRIQPVPDGKAVLFLRSPPREAVLGLYEMDLASGLTTELVTPAALLPTEAEDVSAAEKARRERMRVTETGFTSFGLSPDGGSVLLSLSGRLFLFDRTSRRARLVLESPDRPPLDPRFSPDGTQIAFVRANEVEVLDLQGTGEARLLTRGASSDGTDDVTHGLPEFVAQEEMGRHTGYWWSADGRFIAYAAVDQRSVERFHIADPARPERPPAVFRYPRAGRPNATVRLGIVAVGPPSETQWVTWDQERYPYLARVIWEAPQAPLCLLVQTRDQREAVLLAADPTRGTTQVLLTETDEAWVNLDRELPRWLPDGSGFLWTSERSGRRTLELRAPDGGGARVLVPGSEGFLSLVHVSPQSDAVVVLLGDAVGNRIARVALATGAARSLTTDVAEHAPVFAGDGSAYVDTRVAVDALPESTVHRADGAVLGRVPTVAEMPPFRVNLELVTVGTQRIFNAAVVRPRAFDAGRRYPVVVLVYGGPHSLMVKSDERNYLLAQWIADHGVVVVSADNRGTPRRDRAWERAIKGSFGEIPLADQVESLEALTRRFPEMDGTRVGIYGWSFGGTVAALAVMRRPDVFKVGVAGAPVVDWRDYDTHYTERYLGLPDENEAGYAASSPVTYASELNRPLLLIHGTADDNVYALHSMKLVDALFRAGRRCEFLPLAGVTHQVPDPVLRERLWRRIVEFLLTGLGLSV